MKVIKLLIPVLVVLLVEAYILISLPNNSNAFTNPTNSGGCGGWVQVSTSEFGTCGTSSYVATYTINNTSGKDISVHYNTESWYCQNPSPHMDGSGRLSCREGSPQTSANIRFIPAGGSAGVSIGGFTTRPTMTCGSQQTDFSFKVYHAGVNVCNYGVPNFTDGWSFCTTGQSCNAPTPTMTPVPTAIPTSVPTTVPTVVPPTAVPTEMPQPTEVPVQPTAVPTTQQVINNTSTVCNGVTQVGQVNNANCQTQSQQQNNNQNVVVNVASAQVQPTPTPEEVVQQPQQEVLSATVAPSVVPSQMPSTGAGAQTLLLLGSLIPVGLKLKNLV